MPFRSAYRRWLLPPIKGLEPWVSLVWASASCWHPYQPLLVLRSRAIAREVAQRLLREGCPPGHGSAALPRLRSQGSSHPLSAPCGVHGGRVGAHGAIDHRYPRVRGAPMGAGWGWRGYGVRSTPRCVPTATHAPTPPLPSPWCRGAVRGDQPQLGASNEMARGVFSERLSIG